MYRILILFAALLLGACSQTSELQRPEPPVPVSWPASGAVDSTGKFKAAKTHWRDFFTDPQLQVYVAAALENNRDMHIAAGRVQEARAQYGLVRADLGPTVSAVGSGSYTRSPPELVSSGSSLTGRRYDLSLSSVSYELDFWGRLAGLSESARQSYLSTEEAQSSVRLSLIADVAGAYFALLQTQELTQLARAELESHEQSLALIIKGRDLGGAYDYEVQQASATLASSRATLDGLTHQQASALNRLNFLIGNVSIPNVPGRMLEDQIFEDDLAPGLPAEVLLTRPDVMAAERRLIAAHANIGAARAAFFPKISLTAGLGTASQGLLGLFSGGAWSFLPTIVFPLFDGGRVAAGVEIAEARKVIAVAEYEKTIQQAFREVADLLSARMALVSQMRAMRINTMAQERRLQIVQGRYEAGLTSYLEVLAGQRELLAARQLGVQVRRARLDSTAQLYKALGGGGATS
jgi:multidrug efflux system outer membrane protein